MNGIVPVSLTSATEEEYPLDRDQVSILIVDDLPEKLLAYEAILEELGQNLVTVRTGEDALKMVLKQEFAVILLDVNMPGIDGFETASLIRQRKRSAHTPIIFLTAFTDEVRMAQGYASGAVDYLPTPVVPETLKAKVKVFIELSQMRRKAALQAQEHALRQAAEEAARRSDFLVAASGVFTRAQNDQDILQALIQLPVPFLADIAILQVDHPESALRWVGWNSPQLDKNPYSQRGEGASCVFPLLKDIVAQVVESGQAKHFSHLPATSLSPASVDNIPSVAPELNSTHFTVLAVPFTLRGEVCGALILARSGAKALYERADITLASDFLSRADASLENIMLLNRIKEADQRKNEFLAMLAHELRNPLAPIRNALYVMRMSPGAHLRQQAEETIDRQLNHMVHLVDDLMDVSRITQGKIELRKEIVALSDAINQAVETAQVIIEQRGQTLTVTQAEPPIYLDADFSRISQILSNLLNNAAKYTDTNGHIELSTALVDGNAVITIKDNGIGIPKEMLSRIFDMFLQVDSSLERAQGGLGIGLTLVRNLVEMHGGTIRVHSAGSHQGSEFTVMLPAVAAPQKIEVVNPALATEKKATNKFQVLIVDDNLESAKTLGWMIEEIFGHISVLAHDGAQAMEQVNLSSPDVVLLDIGLPGVNGYEVCKAMHQLPGMQDATFIAQTGWGQAEHRQRSKEAGFHYHLVKPLDIKELEKILAQLAQKRQQTSK